MKPIRLMTLFSLFSLLATGCARVITSGSHNVKSGTTIPGNLLMTSGQLSLEKGSKVAGSILMTSGDIVANGEVEGNIYMSSGNVYVGPEGIIHGDIRGASGSVQQAAGAQVRGDVSANFDGSDMIKMFVLAGTALFFFITQGRRVLGREKQPIREKQPVEWSETPKEKSHYMR
jgi:cytoskeletal protein CcmA (bactofilin family)